MYKKGLESSYNCWLNYSNIDLKYVDILKNISYTKKDEIVESIINEIGFALESFGESANVSEVSEGTTFEKGINLLNVDGIKDEAFNVNISNEKITISASSSKGHLYGIFNLLKNMCFGDVSSFSGSPSKKLRMINHWDNLSGSIERGYAGKSIFFDKNEKTSDIDRIKDYARLLASVGINAVSINNVNADYEATKLMGEKIEIVKTYSDIFRRYGIKTFISANFAAPITLGCLDTADPLSEDVQKWWSNACDFIYEQIHDFGGFVVKADSEGRPGPFTYDRTHADGANMLARAIKKHGGEIIWRCFVYNCRQDWRDHKIDRARAAFDNFIGLDGSFDDNVYLQVKNGPMDFQVKEPVMPLFGAMKNTRILMEFQITQEYTGQQKHICYLPTMWKSIIDFDTYANGEGVTVDKTIEGLAAVVNVGNDTNWTGHTLAQANLYGYGRLCWDLSLSAKEIADEWIQLTFGKNAEVKETLEEIMLNSWQVYENYTAPLGIGWMVNPEHHYGVCVDGYEYSRWGTYHRSNHKGLGMDRTLETGTGYCGQYFEPNCSTYNNPETCPDELLLFFHHVPYTHVLKSGKTVIQHIYDTHFKGYDQALTYKSKWAKLKGKIDDKTFTGVAERIETQIESAREWRDQINTYYYRMTGINDEKGRKIYE